MSAYPYFMICVSISVFRGLYVSSSMKTGGFTDKTVYAPVPVTHLSDHRNNYGHNRDLLIPGPYSACPCSVRLFTQNVTIIHQSDRKRNKKFLAKSNRRAACAVSSLPAQDNPAGRAFHFTDKFSIK